VIDEQAPPGRHDHPDRGRPTTREDRIAKVHAQLDELLELGEISPEAFAEYSATAEALSSIRLDERGISSNN
jgi:hypothetical protein